MNYPGGAISTSLFPDFEGVKKNIELSMDYNVLRDWRIAYQEPALRNRFSPIEDIREMISGNQCVIESKSHVDSLKDGEFFCFALRKN
jgi:hypothetical protein